MPDGHTTCPLCGKPRPPDDLTAADVLPDLQALARETAVLRTKAEGVGAALRIVEAFLFVLSMPVLLPGLAVTALMVKRWGRIPLSLILVEGVLFTGLSYLSFEAVDGPLAGLVFPLMLLSVFSVATLYVLRSWKGRTQDGILLGYSGLVTLLMAAGGGFLYAGTGLVVHRIRAPRFLKVVSDVPRSLDPAGALARKELLVHAELVDARLDASKAAWRLEGAGADVFCAGAADADDALEGDADDLFKNAPEWLGRRVALRESRNGAWKKIPANWRAFIADPSLKGDGRWWAEVGSGPKKHIFLVSGWVTADDERPVAELLDVDAPAGVLMEIPWELLESSNGLDCRGKRPREAMGLALLSDLSPRRYCAPVAGTSGALWVQADGEEAPSGDLKGVLEWPDEGAGRSLALLARRTCGAGPEIRPRVLVLGTAHAYRSSRDLRAEAAEGIPLEHWGALLLGALLTGLAVFLAFFE